MNKNRLVSLSMLPAIAFAAIFGFLAWRHNPFSDAATANCYGQPGTHTALAPSSVTAGKSFKITNITGSANSNIATVNSTKITYSVSGATPAGPTGSWNGGPVNGDYTSHYPDLTLTANGTVGSNVTVNIVAIDANITLAGHDTTISCSVANGQLTANSAGQSLSLASVKIVAPVASNSGSSSSSGSNSNSGSQKSAKSSTNSKAPDKKTTKTESTPDSNDQAAPAEDSTAPSGQTVEFTIVDSQGQPVQGASVVIDSLPAVKTDASGKASISDIAAGQHDLSVSAKGRTVTQELNVKDEPGSVLGVSVSLPAPTHKLRDAAIAAAVIVIALAAAGVWFFKYPRRPPSPLPSQSTAPIESPLPESSLTQPSELPSNAPPAMPPASPAPPPQNQDIEQK